MSINTREIYSMRFKYVNKNVFILGSAPSIKELDLRLLKNQYTFGINSSTILSIENDFIQTFYVSTDDRTENQLLKKVNDDNTIYDYGTKFLSKETIRFMPKFIRKYDEAEEQKRTFYFNLNAHVNKNVFVDSFSNDISKSIYRYYMTPSTAIEIALFLRFKNIFLLGVDLIYPKSGSHFYNNQTLEYTDDEIKKIKKSDSFCMWVYNASKKVYKNGQRIFSCSNKSRLNNLIEYIPFKEALNYK